MFLCFLELDNAGQISYSAYTISMTENQRKQGVQCC
jgi:hypothetical protein